MLRIARSLALTLGLAALLPAPAALALGFTLTPDVDPTKLRPGDTLTVHVGLDEALDLSQYAIDVEFDESELQLTGASQVVCVVAPGPACGVTPSFVIDPTDPNSAPGFPSARRRAVTFDVANALSNDGALTGAPSDALFSLTFTALAGLVEDGDGDLVAGILSDSADELTEYPNGSLKDELMPASTGLGVAFVPEPSTLSLALVGIGALGALRRRGRA